MGMYGDAHSNAADEFTFDEWRTTGKCIEDVLKKVFFLLTRTFTTGFFFLDQLLEGETGMRTSSK